MKNFIIRRIDDLGRIVIPKEIRRILRIKEGTPIEIILDGNTSIVLRPYLTKVEKLNQWTDTIFTTMNEDSRSVKFYFHGSAIVCVRKQEWQISSSGIGIAVCSPNDNYNENIGKCIAYCRAANISIPDFIFED